jgi:hypothetical protein
MKVSNLTNKQGNKVANQFIIEDGNKVAFQSYESLICEIENGCITFTKKYKCSPTTSKYRNAFLSGYFMTEIKTSDVEKMIKDKSFGNFKISLINE